MRERLMNRWVLVGGVLVLLSIFAVACVQIAPAVLPRLTGTVRDAAVDSVAVDQAPTEIAPVATPASAAGSASGPKTATVQRGSISAATTLIGRVVANEEIP